MRIGLLGPIEVKAGADGLVVGLAGQRLRAVLARLALDAGRLVTVDALVDAVWGDDPPAGAVNALQSLVSRLRRVLPEGTVESVPAGYRLAVDPDAVDARRFERLAATGRRALAGGDPVGAAGALREALALWRGPALADVGEASFRTTAAAQLENARLAALEDRIDADLALGRHADVVAELETLTAAHPLRERPHAQLVLALSGASRQADALSTYDQIRRRLASELGMDPGPMLVAAQATVLGAPGKPLNGRGRPAPPPRGNLRPQLTSFVGRASELSEVADLITRERLVTLVGPGGAGKTRLAEECGSRLAERHPGGVWMVALAPVGDGDELDQAVLTSLGRWQVALLERGRALESPAAPDLHQQVVKALGGSPTLLVLDNCEHLVGPAAALAHGLLLDCPELRILATSREPLGVPGERLHQVPSLGLPPVNVHSPADAMCYPAVQLLVDRAAAVRPGFGLDERNVTAIVDISRRLDGLPLALELAAARLRSLSPEQVSARLNDRFRLLTGGSRTALPRHQTLRAVVAWSWDVLTPAERALWRRLSVFPAGATLDGAEQVCADDAVPTEDVLDALASLVDKSLVELAGTDAEPRYQMLETMRAFGAERLAEADETGWVRDAHLSYHLTLVETVEPKLRGPEQAGWIARLTVDYENIAAALRWAVDNGRADPAIRMVAGMTWYLALRGAHQEAERWCTAALALTGESPPASRAIVTAFAAVGQISGGGASYAEATEAAKATYAAIEPFTAAPDAHPVLVLADNITAFFTDDDERSGPAIERAANHNDPWVRALAIFLRAAQTENDGDATRAEPLFTAAKDAFDALGDRWGRSATLSSLAGVRSLRGDHAGAIEALQDAYQLAAELYAVDDQPRILLWLATEWAKAGDISRAHGYLAEGREILARLGDSNLERGFFAATEGNVLRMSGELAAAEAVFLAAIRDFDARPYGPPQIKALLSASYCHVLIAKGDAEAARGYANIAIETAAESHDSPILSGALDTAAEVVLRLGDPSGAAALLGCASLIRGLPDEGSPDVLRTVTTVRAALGEAGYAARYQEGHALARSAVPKLALELLHPTD